MDKSGKPTTGKMTSYSAPAYATPSNSVSTAPNGDVNFTQSASHSLRIASTITAGSGGTTSVVWSQSMKFSNTQKFFNAFNNQTVSQTASGTVLSTHNGIPVVTDEFSYPLDFRHVPCARACAPDAD
jgi:hypothetical protein